MSAPEYLEEFTRAVRQSLPDARGARSVRHEARVKRLAELRGEIERMAAAIAAGLLSPTLRAKLEAGEGEHTRLVFDQSASKTPTVGDFLPRLADLSTALVEYLESVPLRYVDRARTMLKGLIGDVQLIPECQYLTAEIELEGGRLLGGSRCENKCGSEGPLVALLATASPLQNGIVGACYGLVQYSPLWPKARPGGRPAVGPLRQRPRAHAR
jgi:hypothetical protein